MVPVKLGRLPAIEDAGVPFLSELSAAKTLPAPPTAVNWYAGVGEWGMLGNDVLGDCVEAMVGHATTQFTAYAGTDRVATTGETVQVYSEVTGYNPDDPATDQGTVMLGPGGMMQHWNLNGVVFGGVRSFARAYAKLHSDNLTRLQQAIHYFGGVGLGIDLPENVVAGDTIPFVWKDPSGPVAGGHEVWVNGYQTVSGILLFDLISWGARYRMTAGFLEAVTREAVTIYDPDSLNPRGLNPDDFNAAELVSAMTAIRAA